MKPILFVLAPLDWRDRPRDAGAAVRRAYASWQAVYDVGFRVVIEE